MPKWRPSGSSGFLASALGLAMTVLAGPVAATPAPGDCTPGPMPYSGIAGADLEAEVHVSRDADPVRYVRWRGTVPSFDGLPLSVDVTLPCEARTPLPAVLMAHGFTDDKTVWQETGKSDTVLSSDRPASNSRWNNIWFASRGYATVNYTARGWNDSCGPSTAGATPLTPAPQCLEHAYWIHLDDKRWEVRDAQWLLGGIVQSGHAAADRLAMTGGSYGGAPTLMVALLDDQVTCGGDPTPAALGHDPCTGVADGATAPWTTPDGTTPLRLAAAVPTITFADLVHVLAPNGRASDGWSLAPEHGDVTSPVGVPIQSSLTALLAAGNAFGHFAPNGVDPTADVNTDAPRVLAGNPFPADDPLIARALTLYRDFKSPITTPPSGTVPIFWVHGNTDPLFTAFEPLTFMNAVRAQAPDYPIKVLLGDFGHDYAAQRVDEGEYAIAQMNAFVDHYLRPDRTPGAPSFDASSSVTRCLDAQAPMSFVTAPTWHELHPDHLELRAEGGGTTSTEVAGPAATATDPVSTATLPTPGAYRGCRILRPSEPDPTAVTYEFVLEKDLLMVGGPVVDLAVTTTAPDVPLSVRLWDVASDGSAQGLVTRFTHRIAQGPWEGRARFQLAPQGYRFPAGNRIKVEVVANDSPYYQASNIPAVAQVEDLTLTLPLHPTRAAPGATDGEAATPPAGRLPTTGGAAPPLALVATLAACVVIGRRHARLVGGQ